MNLNTVKTLLCAALDANQPTMMVGSPGVGKSAIVREIATDRGLELIDLRLSQVDSLDLRGLPIIETITGSTNTKWATPAIFPTAGEGILFLDEITSASKSVEAAIYQLILDRKLGDYTLPEGWQIIAAGNRTTDGAIVNRMSTALKNRFFYISVTSELETWVNWAFANKVDPSIIAFVKYRPSLLNEFESEGFSPNANNFATQRSWAKLGKLLPFVPDNLVHSAIIGMVGEAAGTEYMAFRLTNAEIPSYEEIMASPSTAKLPFNMSAQFGVATMLTSNLNSKNIKTIMVYLERLPAELTVMVLKQALKLKPMLSASPAFTAWATANQDLIF